MNDLYTISKCEVCNSNELLDVLDLGPHPMCDDLVPVGDDRICKEYPINIVYCKNCFTAHQKYQIPKNELFPQSYHYRSRFTADVLNGMKDLVNDCVKTFGDFTGKKVIDIGCNDGSLLNFFRDQGAITYGLEPTDAYKDAVEAGHTVYNEYLTPEIAKKVVSEVGKFDVITFTNVFAHIENLEEVIVSLKELMTEKTIIVIENHYLGAVIDKKQFDTFYHEHPRTYSYKSFLFIAESLGVNLLHVEFPSRYGGNIRVFFGNRDVYNIQEDKKDEILLKEAQYFDKLKAMGNQIEEWKKEMKEKLAQLKDEYGTIKAKAFPGRAAILVKLLDLDENIVSACFEKPGSMKIGHYLPGTRIPIKSDDQLFETIKEEKVILNLAWHIQGEIDKYLRANGFTGEKVDIL
jgi:SAM-dependent methyltransferase